MGSCCKRSVFWVNWVILTAIYRFWNWRNKPSFHLCDKSQEVLYFPIENLSRFGWQVHCSSFICKVEEFWQATGPTYGEPSPSISKKVLHKDSCACKPLLIDLYWFCYRCSQENESHFVFQAQKGTHIHMWVYGKGTISWHWQKYIQIQ